MLPTDSPRRQHGWVVPVLGIAVVIAVVAIALVVLHSRTAKPETSKSGGTPKTVSTGGASSSSSDTIRLIATGDELPHDSVDANAKTAGGYNYLPFYANVAPYLKADIAYCNQESPSNPDAPVSGYPTFNAPLAFAQDLSRLGCNVINLANNHADDKGQAGINATLKVWQDLHPLAYAGINNSAADQPKVPTFTVKGVKFAFLSYAQCSNDKSVSSYGLNIFSTALADQQIATAKSDGAQMIIAAMHSCDENRNQEDSWQQQTAQYFAEKGVDVVIGTGPHWLQPVQKLPKAGGGNTVVWYSLGNLLSTQLDIKGLIGGVAVMDIDAKTKTVTSIGFLPTYMHYYWTAAQKAADDESARKDLALYPLDQAASAMANSQDNTTVAAQTQYVTQLLNTYTPVTMYTSKTFSK